jgi:hypothetical protein
MVAFATQNEQFWKPLLQIVNFSTCDIEREGKMLQMDNAGGRREQAGWRSRLKRNGYKVYLILF